MLDPHSSVDEGILSDSSVIILLMRLPNFVEESHRAGWVPI